jgi:hypothetical protein
LNAAGMSQGQIIAAVSAVVLVVSLFLEWGGIAGADVPDVTIPQGVPGAEQAQTLQDEVEDAASPSGWESQNTLDLYLAILAGLVLIGAVMTMTGSTEGFPYAPAAATFLLGVIGTILTVYVLIDVPEGFERKIGIYLATAAAIGVTIGSYLQMRDEVAGDY